MTTYKIKFTSVFLLCLMIYFIPSNAQETYNMGTLSTSNTTTKKTFKQTIDSCKKILENQPLNSDVKILLAHNYAWNQQYNEALEIIESEFEISIYNQELMALYLNVNLWNNNFLKLLEAADFVEKNGYNNPYDLYLKRLIAYKNLGQKESFNSLIKNKQNFSDSLIIKKIIKEFKLNSQSKFVDFGYTIDFFDEFSPQHLETLAIKIKKNKNTYLLRANSAQRFSTNDFQMEADYYRKVLKKDYFYLNYGFGFSQNIFPNHRMAGEYFHLFQPKTETSIGLVYLIFNNDEVLINTASVAQYFMKYRIEFRGYFLPLKNSNTYTLIGSLRKYGNFEQNYWGIEASYGNSPVERINYIQSTKNYELNSTKIKLEKNQLLSNSIEIKASLAYHYEEYYANLFRNRYQFEVLIRYRI